MRNRPRAALSGFAVAPILAYPAHYAAKTIAKRKPWRLWPDPDWADKDTKPKGFSP
jgi:hypothetical protein